jgi:hypothetical protein
MLTRHACLLLLLSSPALADSQAAGSDEKSWRRELAGHVFFPSLAVPDPFLSTYLSIDIGAGYAWIDGPGFDIRGNPIGRESYNAEALVETLSFQGSVTRWLALRIGGGGGLDGGSNARSAVAVGMVSPIPVKVGATASWKLGRIVRLGGTFDFVYSYSKLIQPLNALQSSLARGQVETAQVSQKIDGYSVLPGVALAIAPHPAVGLLASAQYLWNGLYGDLSSASLSYFVLGVSAQVDLRPIWERAPVGFLLSYRTQLPFQSGTRFTHTLEGGVFYTGRREIDLGLDVQLRWFDLRPDTRTPLDTLQLLGLFLLRYHWN